MKIAFILYDGITMLDFIGVYDPLTRMHRFIDDLEITTHGVAAVVQDSFGLKIRVDQIRSDLSRYNVVIVPGGFGTLDLLSDQSFLDWIKTAKDVPLKASICTGSLILGAAGMLTDRKATTHFDEYEALGEFCSLVQKDRIVEDKDVITAGAVASSLDLGLYLCEQWVGADNTKWIRERMDYHG